MKCPKCNSDNPDTQQFCGRCGTKLVAAKDIPASSTKSFETPRAELTTGSVFAGRYKIIEEVGRARLFGKQLTVAAGFGQSSSLLSRVRHILGFVSTQQNSRFWHAGIITVSILFALAVPATLALTSWAAEGSHEIKSNLFQALVDPKVNAEGQRILKRMIEVNRYWLIGPSKKVQNYFYDFNLYDRESNESTQETIKVKRPTKVNSKRRQGITYDSILHRLISDPPASIIRKILRNQQIIQLDFIFRDFTDVTCGNGISHTWHGYFTGLVKVGSLWLDVKKMVPVKVKAGWQVEYFSEYVVVDEGHYVPLKITVGYDGSRYHWVFGFYDPGLWLFENAYYRQDERGQPRMVASINNLKINKRSAVKTKIPVVEVPELNEGREVKDRKTSKPRKSVTLTLTEQGMSFEGQTITWDRFPSLLADVPEPENTGLKLVLAAESHSSEKLKDMKTRISILSRELSLKYLSCISDGTSTLEKPCEEYFFTAPFEFNKDIYIRQNVIGEFKQKYYRSEKGWGMDKTEKHKEWATVYVNSINFQKSLFRREVSAKLKIGYISWPEAKYRFTVQLFDDKWKGLAQDSAEFETSGMILSGRTLLGSTELDFLFGRDEKLSEATSFELTILPVVGNEANVQVEGSQKEVEIN